MALRVITTPLVKHLELGNGAVSWESNPRPGKGPILVGRLRKIEIRFCSPEAINKHDFSFLSQKGVPKLPFSYTCTCNTDLEGALA